MYGANPVGIYAIRNSVVETPINLAAQEGCLDRLVHGYELGPWEVLW